MTMAGDGTKVRIGAAWVQFGSVAGSVGEVIDLGYTKGGVTFTLDTSVHEVTVDQEGTSPISAALLGRRVTVDIPLAETYFERLQKIVPESTWNAGTKLFEISSGLGAELLAYGDILRIISKANFSEYIDIYMAVPVGNIRATFLPDQERIWPMQFIGLIPPSTDAHSGVLLGMHEAT